MPKDELYARVASRVSEWLDQTPKRVADTWRGGPGERAPFAAVTTQAERRAYFEKLCFNPDGTPNVPGRQHLLDTYGLPTYTRILRTLQKPDVIAARDAVYPEVQTEGGTGQPPAAAPPPSPQGAA